MNLIKFLTGIQALGTVNPWYWYVTAAWIFNQMIDVIMYVYMHLQGQSLSPHK